MTTGASPILVTCPATIAAELHRETTAGWWADPEYQAIEAAFLRENPVCEYCGRPSQVAHHDDPRVYRSKEAYYDLRNMTPACHACHRQYRRGYVICPECLKVGEYHYMKRGAESCYRHRGTFRKRVNHGRKTPVRHPCQYRRKYQHCALLTGPCVCNYSWRRARDCGGFTERKTVSHTGERADISLR